MNSFFYQKSFNKILLSKSADKIEDALKEMKSNKGIVAKKVFQKLRKNLLKNDAKISG